MTKIGAKITKYQLDNYFELIRAYFIKFSTHKTLVIESDIHIIRGNTVYVTIEHISIINSCFRAQLYRNNNVEGLSINVRDFTLFEIRMVYRILKLKYGKL